MSNKRDGDAAGGRSRAPRSKPDGAKDASAKPRRKSETPTLTDDLSGKFLRVGDKLYRTSDDKGPFARLEPDRLKTSQIDALPDVMRIARANGWNSVRINGGDTFKKAAFLAAAAQGLTVENYTPQKLIQAEADRLLARIAPRAEPCRPDYLDRGHEISRRSGQGIEGSRGQTSGGRAPHRQR
jgi:hypothetical protein